MRGSNLLGGGIEGPRLTRGEQRAARARARAWHRAMKPHFDALDRAGAFTDSPSEFLEDGADA